MIFAAHQPYYLPWPGFFYKLYHAHRFIVADTLQYTKHSYINRTKVAAHGKTCWLTIPVFSKKTTIKEIKIAGSNSWKRKHWQTLRHTYKNTPYFEHYADYFSTIYDKNWTYLVEFNYALLVTLKNCMQLAAEIILASELRLNSGDMQQLLINTGCTAYLTEPENIVHTTIASDIPRYIYQPYPDISIIDALFQYGPETKQKLNFKQIPRLFSEFQSFFYGSHQVGKHFRIQCLVTITECSRGRKMDFNH
jgi:hypothetical protein